MHQKVDGYEVGRHPLAVVDLEFLEGDI